MTDVAAKIGQGFKARIPVMRIIHPNPDALFKEFTGRGSEKYVFAQLQGSPSDQIKTWRDRIKSQTELFKIAVLGGWTSWVYFCNNIWEQLSKAEFDSVIEAATRKTPLFHGTYLISVDPPPETNLAAGRNNLPHAGDDQIMESIRHIAKELPAGFGYVHAQIKVLYENFGIFRGLTQGAIESIVSLACVRRNAEIKTVQQMIVKEFSMGIYHIRA